MENLSVEQLISAIAELERGITDNARVIETNKNIIAEAEKEISKQQRGIEQCQERIKDAAAVILNFNDQLYGLSEQLTKHFDEDPIDFMRRLNGLHGDRAKMMAELFPKSDLNKMQEKEKESPHESEPGFIPGQLDFIFTLFEELAKEDVRLERFAQVMTRAGYYYPFELITLPKDAIVGINGFGTASWKSYEALLKQRHLAPYTELNAKQKEQMVNYVTHNYNTLMSDIKLKNPHVFELEAELISRIDKFKRWDGTFK